MIYIPIDVQLRMIREDIQCIKNIFPCCDIPKMARLVCGDCNLAAHIGAGTCAKHAPEFSMRIELPLC